MLTASLCVFEIVSLRRTETLEQERETLETLQIQAEVIIIIIIIMEAP